MPLVLARAYGIHIETCRGELIIDVIANLKSIKRYARTYDGTQAFGAGMV